MNSARIASFASLSLVFFLVLAGSASAQQPVPIAKGFEPNPQHFVGLVGEATADGKKFPNCPNTMVPAAPSLVLDMKEAFASMFVVTLTPATPNRLNLIVKFSDGSYVCDMAKDTETHAARFKDVPAGKTEIYVGHAMQGAKYSFSLSVLEMGRVVAASLPKAFEPNPRMFDGLSGRTGLSPTKLGLTTGQCSTTLTETPGLVLDAAEGLGPEVKFTMAGPAPPGSAIVIRLADGNVLCEAPYTTGLPSITVQNAPPGKIEIYGGQTNSGYGMVYSIRVEDLERTRAAKQTAFLGTPEGKKKEFCGDEKTELKTRFPSLKVAGAIVVNTVCTGGRGYSWQQALRRGIQEDVDKGVNNPVYAAGLVAACRALPNEAYYGWRQCKREADKVDAAALPGAIDAALAEIPKGALAKELFLDGYQQGAKRLADLTPAMTEHEKGYPNEKAVFDDVVKTVEEKYRPMFKQWGASLHEVDAWYEEAQKGPGFVAGCEDKWVKSIQTYVNGSVKKPSGDALAEALWSPIGHRMVQALRYCQLRLGQGNVYGVDKYLSGGRLYGGTYEMTAEMLRERAFVRPEFEKMPFSNWTRVIGSNEGEDSDPLQRSVGGSGSGRMTFTGGDEVASVTPKGAGKVQISFKRIVRKEEDYYDCVDGKITRIDEHGYIHRESHCKTRMINVDRTTKPIVVPKADAAKVTPGSTVGFTTPDDGARVYWVKRGKDLVWAMGVSAPAGK